MPPLEWGLQAVTMQQEAPAETRSPQREAGITGEERSGNTHQKVTPRRRGSGAFLCAPGFPGTGNGEDLSILQWAQKAGDEGLHLGVVRCPLPEPAGPSLPPCPTPSKMSCRGGRQSVQAPVFGLKCQTDRPEPVAPLLPPSIWSGFNPSSDVTGWTTPGLGSSDSSSLATKVDRPEHSIDSIMAPELSRILASKVAYRRQLAGRSIGDKLRMLDAMRERELAIRGRGAHSTATIVPPARPSHGVGEASANANRE